MVSETRREESSRTAMSDRKDVIEKSSASDGAGRSRSAMKTGRRYGKFSARAAPSRPVARRGQWVSRQFGIGPLALCRGVELEVLRSPEAEQGGDQVGGERLRRGVVVPDDGVVVPAGVLDAVLDLDELLLESEVHFAGLERRVLFRHGEKR